jgi:hypothetical protein
MPEVPGEFQFGLESGPARRPLVSWVLVDAKGDVMAVSYAHSGGKTAQATVQWIIDNAKDCKIIEAVPGSVTRH